MSKDLYERELDFDALGDMSFLTMRASRVPDRLWGAVQSTQYGQVTEQITESLPTDLSSVEYSAELAHAAARAALITDFDHLDDYTGRRQRPNEYGGQRGNNPDQAYKNPRLTVVFDQQDRVVASVMAVINASPTFSGLAGQVHQQAKLHSPQWLPTGGHRYVRISDLVTADVEEPSALVAATAQALARYDPKEKISAYRMLTPAGEPDPADAETEWFVSIAELERTDSRHVTGSPGYPGGALQQRFEGAAGDVKERLLALGGGAISGMNRLRTAPSRYYMA